MDRERRYYSTVTGAEIDPWKRIADLERRLTALQADARDAARIEALPRFAAAIIWKPEAKLPTLGTLKHGFDSGELRAWLDDAARSIGGRKHG